MQRYVMAEGFDTCQFVNSTILQAWWTGTPWYVYGTYLGGDNGAAPGRGCVAMSSSTITFAISEGWALEPFWYGPQMPASCTGLSFPYLISLDTSTAYDEGVAQAQAANSAAASFGYGTFDVIYYDMEATGSSSSCLDAAHAFVNGWDWELSAYTPYWGGLYGSTCSSQLSSFATIPNVPYAIAPRDVNHDPTGVYGLSCLPDRRWANEQRIHQLSAYDPLTYGGYPLTVDEDCTDGPVDTNSGARDPFNCNHYTQ
ncbi:MAG TPA: glycoside hydrolase domain-containing protein [Nitrososphaerales archaeon]|nr:glycoside hydrolase domain-containing protein [Nitrososphaerales archaeon]